MTKGEMKMETENSGVKRRRGAQPGNQNARKYDPSVFTPEDGELLGRGYSVAIEGIDKSIAIIRTKIKSLLRESPSNYNLILIATSSLAKLIRFKQRILRARQSIRFPRQA